jgi:hypothetical protein
MPIGERLLIVAGEIECAVFIGKTLVGGLKDGSIVLWTGIGSKGSRLHNKIKTLISSSNF